MSMLAGPRRKQKLSSDPRGLNWSNDSNKFGQKMLERMGWETGKGLGANEDGRQKHVQVLNKNDSRGVGCSKSYADNWIAHQDDFNSLLSELNEANSANASGDENQNAKIQNLEKVSKEARGRVHYQKFTRGKDLSSKRANDLDCVFGRRKSAIDTPQTGSEETSDADGELPPEESKDNIDSSFGVKTISSKTSVADYFSQKMAELKAKRESDAGPRERESSPLTTGQNGDVDEGNDVSTGEEQEQHKKKKKKKKRDAKETPEDTTVEEKITMETNIQEVEETAKQKKKKIKKKREFSDSDSNVGPDVDVHTSRKKSKKSKKSRRSDQDHEDHTDADDSQGAESVTPLCDIEHSTIKKKKRKSKAGNSGQDIPSQVHESPLGENDNPKSDSNLEKTENVSSIITDTAVDKSTRKKNKSKGNNVSTRVKLEKSKAKKEEKSKAKKKEKSTAKKKEKSTAKKKEKSTAKKEAKYKQFTSVNSMFPGSNISAIGGYGGGVTTANPGNLNKVKDMGNKMQKYH